MNAPLTRRRRQSVNEYLRDRAIRHAVYFQRLTAGEIQQIVGLLNEQVMPDLLERIERALASSPRLAALRDATRDVLHGGFGELKRRLVDDLVAIGTNEAEWQTQIFRSAVPHLDVDWATPSPAMLRAIVTSKPFEGEPLGTWWNGIEADTQAKVLEQLKIGLAEGDSIDDLVRRIRGRREEGFQDGVMQGTRRNIASVVRTATNHVSNDARQATYQENTDVVKGWQFVATLDDRTTIICAANDGKIFPVDDTAHAPPLHWGCLPADRLVSSRFKVTGCSKRWFDGDLVVIRTASGRELAATPNHPVLGATGFRPIGSLRCGDHVISNGLRDRRVGSGVDHHDAPARIEEFADAFLEARGVRPVPVPVTAEDFHGDATDGDIAVVWSDRLLRGASKSGRSEPPEQLSLVAGDAPGQKVRLSGARRLAELAPGVLSSAGCGMGLHEHRPTLRPAGSLPPRRLLRASVPNGNPSVTQDALDRPRGAAHPRSDAADADTGLEQPDHFRSGDRDTCLVSRRPHLKADLAEPPEDRRPPDAELARQIIDGAAGLVFADEVVHVERRQFSGHVFNLETVSGFYVADGIVVHNCRSTTVPVLKSFDELGIKGLDELPAGERAAMDGQVPATETFEEWLREQPASVQDEVLGSSRAEIFRRGELSLDRFVDDKNRVLTLEELRALEAEGGGDEGGGEPPGAPPDAPAPINPSGADTRARLDAVLEAVEAQQRELAAKLEALERDLRAATSGGNQAATVDLLRRIGRLGSARMALLSSANRIAHRILRVADPARVAITGATKPTKEARVFLSSILSRQAAPDGLSVVQVTERAGERAYYDYSEHAIHIARRGRVKSSVHEMGHALEDRYPRQFAERVRDFLWRRAQADRRGLRSLGDIYRQPGWNPGEIAWEDEFVEPYMGKFYPVPGTTLDQFREIVLNLGPVAREQLGATEITSMGVEWLYLDPIALMRRDPEFFDFIVNLLRGR